VGSGARQFCASDRFQHLDETIVARTQLCLHWTVSDLPAFQRALDAAEFATVFIEGANVPMDAQAILPLIEYAQSKNVAALVVGDAQLARICRADGVHLPWSKTPDVAYAEAREILGNRYIVGVDAGRSRHDAMHLGEIGVDYVGFGIPGHVEDIDRAGERRLELVSWWAEIFEVPVVALDVASGEDAAALAKSRAEFVALRLRSGDSADQIRRMTAAIRT
jgi:thiamine-phosphate pyrophosphorylase